MTPEELLKQRIDKHGDISEHLQFIHDAVVEADAGAVVELGVRCGDSTAAILCALRETGGHLYSCDIQDWPETRQTMAAAGLDSRWQFYVTNDMEWGRKWTEPIDVLFIDSSHERLHTEEELRMFGPHVREGGLILLHDTVSFREGVQAAVDAFLATTPGWTYRNFPHNNGLGVLTRQARPSGRVCRFPLRTSAGLQSTSGQAVAIAALSQAIRHDSRFALMGDGESEDDVLWFPASGAALIAAIRQGRRVAIGPQVLYGNSRRPGADPVERELMQYENFAAIFTFSRWYSGLLGQTMRQKTGHVLLDYPLPRAWIDAPHVGEIKHDVLLM